jgi:hypothetical protein
MDAFTPLYRNLSRTGLIGFTVAFAVHLFPRYLGKLSSEEVLID